MGRPGGLPIDDGADPALVHDALDLRVAGGTPGNLTAGHVGTARTYGGYGPYLLQILENGIQRRVEAAVPDSPYPLLYTPLRSPPPRRPASRSSTTTNLAASPTRS